MPFTERDPFNPQNEVSGEMVVDQDAYGDIHIESVNGRLCPQYIRATPKFKYPGGHESPRNVSPGDFNFEWARCFVYEKLDGTNVCMYTYQDAAGCRFVTYKTRLRPFLGKGAWGDFIRMWTRMRDTYTAAFQALTHFLDRYNFAFELYGAANKILVRYDVFLDTRLLYAIDRSSGDLSSPSSFPFPSTEIMDTWDRSKDGYTGYLHLQETLETRFTRYKTVEGCMLYFQLPNQLWRVFKCKPPSVLDEQGSANRLAVGYNDAYTTAVNALEGETDVVAFVTRTTMLLKETYSEIALANSGDVIQRACTTVLQDIAFQKVVIAFYTAHFTAFDKKQVMPLLAARFGKHMSTQLYHIIRNYTALFSESG